ncbi:Gfo/Idh/MocA family oxidoreductase [Nonomuraea angiospora]|uniref:Gfo/Idh/MocA family protein n=1 Tax=Nonomuraea angiospora TaxID=46172 RepID=UPI00342D0284
MSTVRLPIEVSEGSSTEPVAVGLVGAGPWARATYVPMLSSSPHTRLCGVWTRRPEAASDLGVPVFRRLADLFDACEAVAFCVPPEVQPELAIQAVEAGKAVLLEKPLAADLTSARLLVDAIVTTGVASQMALTMRYALSTRVFLQRAHEIEAFGGHAFNVSGGLLREESPDSWRSRRGALLDIGPHLIDVLDAALGRVTAVQAHGDPRLWTGLLLDHEGGRVSELSLSRAVGGQSRHWSFSVFGAKGSAKLDKLDGDVFGVLSAEFADTVRRGGGHPLDAAHGLRLQEITIAAEEQL